MNILLGGNKGKGKVAVIDDQDYYLNNYSWCYNEGHACASINKKIWYMERFILGAKKNQKVIHLNKDNLDNRRENLVLKETYRIEIDKDILYIITPKGTAKTNSCFYNLVSNRGWYVNYQGYMSSTVMAGNKDKGLLLHRLVMNATSEQYVDHINLDRLDCTKENLRFCTRQENVRNSTNRVKNQYKGVRKVTTKMDLWQALITLNTHRFYLGSFLKEEDAAIAYNIAAKELFKEFAWLNPVEDRESVVTTKGKVINKEYIQQLVREDTSN